MILKSKKFWLSATIAMAMAGGVVSYPHILRWQIEKRIPGVQFQDAQLHLDGVTITGVTLDKGWIKGNLFSVSSDFQGQNIFLDGGTLNVDLDSKPKGGETEGNKKNITFKNLELKVSYNEHEIMLRRVRTEDQKICFSEASLETPHIETVQGCFDKETRIIEVEEAKLKELNIMGAQVKNVIAHKIVYDAKNKTVNVNEVEGRVVFESQMFSIEADGVQASRRPDTINLETLKVQHPWLASDWITVKNVNIQRDVKWNITVGKSQIQIEPKTLTFSGAESCDSWIDSLPHSLKEGPLAQIKMTGQTSFSIGFRPKPSFQLKSDCRATCGSLPNLRSSFYYTAYTPTGEPFERESGPRTKGWIPLQMTGDMFLAVVMMEDPGFENHRGFITQAFVNSFTDNLKQGRFLRGGSTITMQLVKNLWLTREKTLSRKVQEFFLAQGLESCYSKDEIMELYLNVVEFGPNKYGVGSGSMHWFKKGPGELAPPEAFWLASILPKPNRTGPPTDEAIEKIESMMKRLASDGRIPEFMPDEEEQQEVQ